MSKNKNIGLLSILITSATAILVSILGPMTNHYLGSSKEMQQNNGHIMVKKVLDKEQSSLETNPTRNIKNLDLTFIKPRNGSIVPIFSDIEYKLIGQIPLGFKSILLIRDPLNQYWSWGSDSNYKNIQIGVPDDAGRKFEIGILVTEKDIPINIPIRRLPAGILFRFITVTRQ